MARLAKKKISRAEAIQNAKTTAAANVIGVRTHQRVGGEDAFGLGPAELEAAIKKLSSLDTHILIWPQDFVRIGRLLASIYVSILVPESIRVERHVTELPPHGFFLREIEKVFKLSAGAFVVGKFPKMLAWLLAAIKKGEIGLQEFQEFIRAARFIAPLTGEVDLTDLRKITERAQAIFVPIVLALGKILQRTQNPKRFKKTNVYGRRPVHGRQDETLDKIKELLKPLLK